MRLTLTFRFEDPADAQRAGHWVRTYIATSWLQGATPGRTKALGTLSLFEVGVITTNEEDANAIIHEMASGSGEEVA